MAKREEGGMIPFGKVGKFLEGFERRKDVRRAVRSGARADKGVQLERRRHKMEVGVVYLEAVADLIATDKGLTPEKKQSLFVASNVVSNAVQAQGLALIFDALAKRQETKVGGKKAYRRSSVAETLLHIVQDTEETVGNSGATTAILYDIGKYIEERVGGSGRPIYALYDKNGVMTTPDKYMQPVKEEESKVEEDPEDAVEESELNVEPPTPDQIRSDL